MEASISNVTPATLPVAGTPQHTAAELLKQASALIADEKADQARGLLSQFLEDHDRPDVWLKLAKTYRLLGDRLAARAILRNIVLKFGEPHIMDIIAARIPHTKAIVQDNLKLVYINIPKCGSSTLKDAVLVANQRELRGETSHFHVREFEKIIPFSALDGVYAGHTKLAVIRPPRDRLRSYFTKNVVEAESLVREAKGKETFYGLSTLPSYDAIVANFSAYRNIFDDFRHHTDSIVGYLGQEKKRYTHIFDISETSQAIALLKELTGADIPVIHNMKSKNPDQHLQQIDLDQEAALIDSFYDREIQLYFT